MLSSLFAQPNTAQPTQPQQTGAQAAASALANPGKRWPHWWRVLVWALTFNTVVATVLWATQPRMGSWWQVAVVSHCIGLCICGLCVLLTNLPRVRQWPSPWARVALFVPGSVLGYLIGAPLGLLLLGHPEPFGGLMKMSSSIGWLALLTTGLATAFAGYDYLARERLAREALARQRAEALATRTELQLLRAQLQPHMLFNTLANLRALIGEDPKAAQGMLDSFNLFLRGVLAASRSDQHSLQAEFAQLQAYLELMAVRMGPRFSWALQLPPELREQMLPCLILQPLVENAIKHGLEPQVGPVHLSVSAKLAADGQLQLSVQDSGRGLAQASGTLSNFAAAPMRAPVDAALSATGDAAGSTPSDGTGSTSYGLAHVRERLRSAYPGKPASLSLAQVPAPGQGCLAQIHLPSRATPAVP